MDEAFIGSEAIAAGALTPYQLRTRFNAVYRDVYIAEGVELSAAARGSGESCQ